MDLITDENMTDVPKSGEPDIPFLQEAYSRTVHDLQEWVDQRERDYYTRNCKWDGKSEDFKKHNRNAETGEVFPWDGASDHESREVDDLINTKKAQCINAIKKAYINAIPVESNDIQRAAVISNFMRWLINAKMEEFYEQIDLGIDHLLEKSIMVHSVEWDYCKQQIQQELTLEDAIVIVVNSGGDQEQFMTGELDDQYIQMLTEGAGVSEKKAKAMLTELRTTGKTTVPLDKAIRNQPVIKALPPDEDFFMPSWTIEPQKVPYCFHVIHMTPQELRAKITEDDWDEEFVEEAIQTAGQQHDPALIEEWHRNNFTDGRYDETVRIIYTYQRLLDEDNVQGIYRTIMCYGVDAYAKHELLDYQHGQYPFIVTPLERTSKRLYSARSLPELAESYQQVIKAETDASIDRQSLATMPPLKHTVGRKPTKYGPAVRVPVLRMDEIQWDQPPRFDQGSYVLREYIETNLNRYWGRNAQGVDPIEAQVKQQYLVDIVLGHIRKIFNQVYSLYQQFGPDEEYFRVVGVVDQQKYTKGKAGERYDFWIDFDIGTQDPAQVLERAKATAELGQMLDRSGTLDTQQLLQIVVGQLWPGAADRMIQPVEQAQEKAIAEERQTIAELVAGVPPNVRQDDAHQIKMQVFEQWAAQPDIQQKMQQDPALAERAMQYQKQRQFQIQQQQNAQIGRTGTAPTAYGQTAQQ